jgi:hypothetical protein
MPKIKVTKKTTHTHTHTVFICNLVGPILKVADLDKSPGYKNIKYYKTCNHNKKKI